MLVTLRVFVFHVVASASPASPLVWELAYWLSLLLLCEGVLELRLIEQLPRAAEVDRLTTAHSKNKAVRLTIPHYRN